MHNATDPKQWCELHNGHSHDIRTVRIGAAAADRFTVMVCPECAKELVDYGWAQPVKSFNWDFIFPSVQRFRVLQHFVSHA